LPTDSLRDTAARGGFARKGAFFGLKLDLAETFHEADPSITGVTGERRYEHREVSQ
jgi:hypothetical protein